MLLPARASSSMDRSLPENAAASVSSSWRSCAPQAGLGDCPMRASAHSALACAWGARRCSFRLAASIHWSSQAWEGTGQECRHPCMARVEPEARHRPDGDADIARVESRHLLVRCLHEILQPLLAWLSRAQLLHNAVRAGQQEGVSGAWNAIATAAPTAAPAAAAAASAEVGKPNWPSSNALCAPQIARISFRAATTDASLGAGALLISGLPPAAATRGRRAHQLAHGLLVRVPLLCL
eukprot:scaffold176382_cov18-Tisochrysis_lutea.AAC.2